MWRIFYAFILMFSSGPYAQGPGEKIKLCKEKLLEEIKIILAQDQNDLIQAQLTLTTFKIAQKILDLQKKNSSLINAFLQDNSSLYDDEELLEKITELYLVHGADITSTQSSFDNNQKNDREYLKSLQGNLFNNKDRAVVWFAAEASRNSSAKSSFLISSTIDKLFLKSKDPEANIEEVIAKNFKSAQENLKAQLQKIKMDVFSRHKELCLDLYDSESNPESQNESLFLKEMCKEEELNLLDNIFESALRDINSHFSLAPVEIKTTQRPSANTIRGKQDLINSKATDHERIVEFYRQGLGSEKCGGFILIDKIKQQTYLYSNDGNLIMATPSIIGRGTMRIYPNSTRIFNPDSTLRSWGNATDGFRYSYTTGAGVFYVNKSLTPQERKKRKYDQEFNDRVLVLYSKKTDPQTQNLIQREEIQAIHGVPNDGWVNNRDQRMKSFEQLSNKRNISTGCVNLEAYTYDLIDQYLGSDCPIYILPQDENNYFYVKDGVVAFSSGIKERKTGEEKARIRVNGQEDVDQENRNIYNYTPIERKYLFNGHEIKDPAKQSVVNSLIDSREELFQRARQMSRDDFHDYLALTYSIATGKESAEEAKEIFLNLYRAEYRYRVSATPAALAQFEKMNIQDKRILILEKYNKEFGQNVGIMNISKNSLGLDLVY
jgi:hypothetical protein